MAGILLTPAVMAGCSSAGGNPHAPATQPAAAVPVTIPAEDAPKYANSDSFDTTLSPPEAVAAIARVFKDDGFTAVNGTNASAFTGNYPVSFDYFSGSAFAQTSLGKDIQAVCRWKREGQTNVELKSNLPAAQHVRLVQQVRTAIEFAATQPAALTESKQ